MEAQGERMSFCPVCGTQRVSRFCSQCGHDFGLENLSDQVQPAEETSEKPEALVDDSASSGALEPEVEASSAEVEDAKALDATELAQEDVGSVELELVPSEVEPDAEAADQQIEIEAARPDVESVVETESDEKAPSELNTPSTADPKASLLEQVETPSLAVALPVAGWYLDPKNPTRLRFWDGTAWTDRLGEYLIPQGKEAELTKGKRSDLGEKKTKDKKCGFCQYPASEGSVACRACGQRL